MTIRENQGVYEIRFPFNRKILDAVRNLPNRRFLYNEKIWIVPSYYRQEVESFAQTYGFQFEGDQAPENFSEIPPLPELNIDISLKMEMFPFQKNGVARSLELKRLIIGDDMGLGKTIQSIATVIAAKAFPCLVICPASLKINWEREWLKWSTYRPMIMNDGVKRTWNLFFETGMVQVFIINYESLKKYFVDEIIKEDDQKLRLNHVHFNDRIKMFKSIIIDEFHRCKDPGTQQSKFTKGIASGKEYVLGLTGTPVVNKPRDLVSQLGILDRLKDLGGYRRFMMRFCDGMDGASNLHELNYLLNKHCYFRRSKQEVLRDLPDKMRQAVMCDITTRKEYNDAISDLASYLRKYRDASDEQVRKSMRGEVMVRIGICKNIAARGKMLDVVEYLSDVMESGEKIVLFVHLREIATDLKKKFPGAVTILGGDNEYVRQSNIDAFQNDVRVKMIICSIKAAGVGITLTASSRVYFLELPWTYADCDQCESRCHRIGQKDSVQCTYFLGKDTIDEWIYNEVIMVKKEMADTITGNTDHVEHNYIESIMHLMNIQNK